MFFLEQKDEKNIKVNWNLLDRNFLNDSYFQNEVFLSSNFISKNLNKSILDEINDQSLDNLNTRISSNENKSHTKKFGLLTSQLIRVFNSDKFTRYIEEIFKFKKNSLIYDNYFSGGGIHLSKKNQFLKMHQDFNFHPISHMKRVVNIIIYLNEEWEHEYGGVLSLEREKNKKIESLKVIPNQKQIVFRTDTNIWHGVNKILVNKKRVSIALYYYEKASFLSILLSLFTGRMTKFISHKGIRLLIPYLQHKLVIIKNIFQFNKLYK